MGALLLTWRGNAIRSIGFLMGLALGTAAFGQVRNDRLLDDIVSGGVNELSLSLAAGLDPNTELLVPVPDDRREVAVSLMALSVSYRNDDAAAQLLQLGAELDPLVATFSSVSSPLMLFAEAGLLRTLITYIDRDDSVLVEDGGTAFVAAVGAGHWPVARLLLDRTIALVGQDQLQAPLEEALIWVARQNDVAATQTLLELGADPSSGLPLIAAVVGCSPDTVEQLLDYSADALPYYEDEHAASYAQRCLSEPFMESGAEAVATFSQIVQLLYESDSTICPILVDVQPAKSSKVDSVLENLGICQ